MTDEVGAVIEETVPAVLAEATVTLVEGPTFCVSGTSGDMEAEVAQGLFFRDMRVISDWQIRVDGHRPHHLTVLSQDPYSTTFVSRVPPHGAQSELLLERRRYVGEWMREDLRLRNLSTRAALGSCPASSSSGVRRGSGAQQAIGFCGRRERRWLSATSPPAAKITRPAGSCWGVMSVRASRTAWTVAESAPSSSSIRQASRMIS
ncbi:glycogen debranching N-terminal domain-containing protein [Streptomyces werraensis]|uniref:glycogen debranching N-terminal domain-containing protein n=1 Tax=Streptomyces werraensis TaxID=68284 RepID=UPI0036936991